MSERIFLYTVLLGFSIITISNATALNTDENEAREFAKNSSESLFEFFGGLKDEHDYIVDINEHNNGKAKFFADLNENAKKFDYKNFKDSDLKYAIERIVKITEERGEPFFKIRQIIDNLLKLSRDDTIEEYDKTFRYFLHYHPDIKDIIETSNNPEELKFYWKKWREESSHWAKKNLKLIVNKLKVLPDVSPLLRNYNFNELEKMMHEMNPLYMELHAFIRDLLHTKYGDSVIKSDGLIPHHLFEQVIAQIWSPTNESLFEKMYQENLPEIDPSLNSISVDLYTEGAAEFYKKLGFTQFSDQVWKYQIEYKPVFKPRDDDDKIDCKADVYNSNPYFKLEYCFDADYKRLLEFYSVMARIYYAKEMTGLPAYFFDSQDLEFAIGKAIVLSASTYHNLQATKVISSDFNVTKIVEMNRLLRKCIDNILKIRVDFIHIKLIADLLLGNIELKDLNEKYWQLMEKYVGVGPPLNHKSGPDTFDMPVEFYNFIKYIFNNEDSRKIDSEILSYQIYQKLCELGGKYPKEPLHRCDFNGSKDAGAALQNVMKLGATKPFNEVLETMLPENPKISVDSILEYYSPVKKWLAEKNKESNVKPGWKH